MRWKQFFTPVDSLDAVQTKQYMESKPLDKFTLLDVRQPSEYAAGHIPGATIIPLPDLKSRMSELDADKPAIVYCAIGGRSRIAAQMLAAADFKKVFNLTGGFKAWQGGKATGPENQGLELFSGRESPAQTLIIAYSLEQGLRDFYLLMIPKVTNPNPTLRVEVLKLCNYNVLSSKKGSLWHYIFHFVSVSYSRLHCMAGMTFESQGGIYLLLGSFRTCALPYMHGVPFFALHRNRHSGLG